MFRKFRDAEEKRKKISASGADYCGVAFCNNSKAHVMCQFQLEGPARHCINYERTIKSALDQQVVLDKINSRRNKVASGEIRSLGAADNMMKMDWNEELASSAQRWADQCVSNNSPDLKDTCRDLSYSQVGQNIATVYDDAPGLTPAMLVDLWYIELLNVNSSTSVPLFNYQRHWGANRDSRRRRLFLPTVGPFDQAYLLNTSPAAGSEHYDYFTQLIWAETTHVGCGAVKFKEEIDDVKGKRKRTVYRLVCNFAPAGNQIHKAVYSVGSPCTRCPFGTCDCVFTALCTQNERHTRNEKYENISTETKTQKGQQTKYYTVTESLKQNLNNISKNITDILSAPKIHNDSDENISFDFITDPPKFTVQSSIHNAENTTVCKDVLAVDELFDLLKRKLSSDGSFRELLLTRQSPPSTEETFTDPSVAAIMSKIYSTKLLSTTTQKTDNEFLNSTLLVDLVEAVIFRNSDKMATFEVTELNSPSTPDVNPVKIQAELGEVRSNSDFAGHYFFPEDENDHPSSEKLENYYDITDFPISDVAFEIEELRRNKGTKDFLEDILESDFVTETETQVHINDDLTITQS